MITATRYHDLSCGHRVAGHESKCAHLHGHNYRIHFEVVQDDKALDALGRVLDFSVINTLLCQWLETHWDHKFLAWSGDDEMQYLRGLVEGSDNMGLAADMLLNSVVWVPFNPTAENMAQNLVEVVGPQQLKGTGCRLVRVIVEETRKCSASYSIKSIPIYTTMNDIVTSVQEVTDIAKTIAAKLSGDEHE